jgi:hypothetical protein
MLQAKSVLLQTTETGPVGDTSTLAGISSLSITDDGIETSRNTSSVTHDYQIFILAGVGHKLLKTIQLLMCSLYPLMEDGLPKALLPAANTPLLYYPLEWCKNAGFTGLSYLIKVNCRRHCCVSYRIAIANYHVLGVSVRVSWHDPVSVGADQCRRRSRLRRRTSSVER